MSLNFQNGASPLIEQLVFFHDWVIVFVTSIAVGVVWYLLLIVSNKPSHRILLESQGVEFAWTALPCLVLVAIALPSLRLLYIIDDVGSPSITIKRVGHQWYWSYEYSDIFEREIDAYMSISPYRLQDCDHRLLLPAHTPVRVLITAADVLHSWTVPVIGIKADAVPGRLNQLSFYSDRVGVFFGQCREICGRNHRFMPIVSEVVSSNKFLKAITV